MTRKTNPPLSRCPLRIDWETTLDLITGPWIRKGFGLRHLWIGYSGSGKTVANCYLSERLKQEGIVTIATDQKARVSRYDDRVVTSEEELNEVNERSCVVRGMRSGRIEDRINFDRLAKRIWHIGQRGVRVALVIDELSDAQKAEKYFEAPHGQYPWMSALYRQGRELGVTIAAATQLPQEIPRSAYSLSDSIGFFRQDGHEAEYYQRLHILSPEDVDHVAKLPQYAFLLWRRGDKERYISQFPL